MPEFPWIRLKKNIGTDTAVIRDTQEGQVRYDRPLGATDGKFLVGRMVGSALEWYDLLAGIAAAAPKTAKYIVQTADATLTAEQSLGALTTGILKNTVTAGTGVLSTAVGADLPSHTHAEADVTSLVADLAGKQPLDTDLTAIAALTSAADKMPYSTGAGTWALADLSSAQRTFQTTPSSANLAALLTDETGTGAAVFAGGPTFTGTVHVAAMNGTGSSPTYTVGAAMGTTPGSQNLSGTDFASTIIQSTGTVPPSGVLWSVGFAVAKAISANRIFLSPLNGNSASLDLYVTNRSTTGFDIACNVAPGASVQIAVCVLVLDT